MDRAGLMYGPLRFIRSSNYLESLVAKSNRPLHPKVNHID